MINQTSKGLVGNPRFWQIVVLSVTLIILCQSIGTQTLSNTNQITGNNDLPTPSATSNSNSFISTWNTSITYPGSSNSTEIRLPLISGGQYNFMVQWGDGSNDTITTYDQAAVTHNYVSAGVYTLNITGTLMGWNFNYTGDCQKITEISQWGNITLGNSGYYFAGCSNLVLTAQYYLNLNGTTNLAYAFANCSQLGVGMTGNMQGWNTAYVTNMSYMFYGATGFDQTINAWNTANVTNMAYMFYGDTAFNQPISSFIVKKVTDMAYMFYNDSAFTDAIDNWNTANVTNMEFMFYNTPFNQNIGSWNVSNVTNMAGMFWGAEVFNQSISNWNVSSVTDMNYMFFNDNAFNQPIGNWVVSCVTDMADMFAGDSAFNQPIGNWDVSSVTKMTFMFCGDSAFNQPIGNWDVSSVTDMTDMFAGDFAINQSVGNWDVSSVIDMSGMFANTPFNQNIGNWNVSSVTDMSEMFTGDTAFSTENYGLLLIGWSQLSSLQMNVNFSAGSTLYPARSANARQDIITNYNWSISDGGLANALAPTLSPISSPSNSGNVTLDWSSSLSDSSYAIYRSYSPITTTTLADTSLVANVTDDTYKDTSNLASGTYYYVVLATNGNGSSLISNCRGVTVITLPSGPINLNETAEANSILLTWETPANNGGTLFLHYCIYRSDSANGSFTLIGISTTLSYNDTNVFGGKYFYKITALNEAGESNSSNIVNVTMILKPSGPTNLLAMTETNSILLTWETPINNGGSTNLIYDIYRADSVNGPFTLIGNSTTTSYNDTNVSAGQNYYYEVSAVNSAGASGYTNVANTTFIESNNLSNNILSNSSLKLIIFGIVGWMVAVVSIISYASLHKKAKKREQSSEKLIPIQEKTNEKANKSNQKKKK